MKFLIATLLLCSLMASNCISQTIIKINKSIQYQQIDGFGALVTDHNSTEPMRDNLAELLVNDLGLSIFRNYLDPQFEPTNDNNDPNVLDLSKFNLQNKINIACDGTKFMPVELTKNTFRKLQSLVKKNGDSAILITSVASPPKWMKYTNCAYGSDVNYNRLITFEENAKIIPRLPLNDDYKAEFAEFCEAYLQYMKQEGISIHRLSIQNNPYFGEPYSSCVYRDSSYIATLNKVGQRITSKKLKTNLMFNEDIIEAYRLEAFFNLLKNNNEKKEYGKIVAFQSYQTDGALPSPISAYSFNSMIKIINKYDSALKIYSTEAGDDYFSVNILNALKNGKVSAWVCFSPFISGCDNGLINFDLSKKYNYHVLKHFSKSIKQGAVQVSSEVIENDLYSVAFQHNKNKTLTIVMVNNSTTESKTVKLSFDESQQVPKYFNQIISQNHQLQYQDKGIIASTDQIILPPHSIVTLIGEESGIIAATNNEIMKDLNSTAYFNSETNKIYVDGKAHGNTEIIVRDINAKVIFNSTVTLTIHP